MAKCSVCGKSVHFGNAVSHSHRRSNKMWKPNVKNVRIMVNGSVKKMPVCTSCLRSGKVERAIAKPKYVAETAEAAE
ncbi:MAG: 50S ribosomal protein L28 [Lachnospiraceae bacterium]|nr:50S ribosomal protein L28 [Lachnospiraceae bacterium]